MFQPFRYALRSLRSSPGFALTAALCLGLGIGANAALFGIFDALLWKPLPVRNPSRIVRAFASGPAQGRLYHGFSYPEYTAYAGMTGVLEGLVATRGVQAALRTPGAAAARAFGEAVSANYFEMLGLRPRLGRFPDRRGTGRPDAVPEVVLSHRLWERRFDAAPDAVGRTVWLSGAAFTVVGVAPSGFNGTYPSPIFAPEFWVPLDALPLIDPRTAGMVDDRADHSLGLLARLRPEASLGQAQRAFDTTATAQASAFPTSNQGVTVRLFRELDTRPEVYSSRAVNLAALLFLGLGALVLLVACANLANLQMARHVARSRDTALRLALGATRGDLVRQFAAEALVLSAGGGGLGLLMAVAASRLVSSVRLPVDLPIVLDVSVGWRALGFTLALSTAAALAFGLAPAVAASRPGLTAALKGGGAVTRGRRRPTATRALVVAQVACSVVLLVAAGLFWRSIAGTRRIAPGIALEGRTLVSFDPSLLRYDPARGAAFYGTLLERVSRAPSIDGAGLVGWVPLGFAFEEAGFVIRGEANQQAASGETAAAAPLSALADVVSPGAVDALGLRVLEGRRFTDSDAQGSQPVAIVNETFARLAWPGRDPIGRQVRATGDSGAWLTVVGTVADGKYRTLTEPPQPLLLRPLKQASAEALTLVARSRAGHADALAAIRREVQSLDPDMPLLDVKTMDQQMAKVRFLPQATTALAGPAAAIAMAIASIGLYGVMAFAVRRRTREFGIRRAVGARTPDILRVVMAEGLTTVGIGLSIGLAAALALARVMRRLLVGVSATDPLVFVGAPVLLAAVAALAIYLPARQASRVDPLVALREE